MENKMNEYQVVKCSSIEDLEKSVTELIRMGWQPIGNLQIINYAFVASEPKLWYFQSMVSFRN